MPNCTLAPVFRQQLLTDSLVLASGYKLFFYEAGTSTKTDTYTDYLGSGTNTNPVVLDASGRATIFLDVTKNYKVVYTTPTDTDPPTSPLWTQDNVSPVAEPAVNVDITGTAGTNISAGLLCVLSDGLGGRTAGRWYLADNTYPYASSHGNIFGFARAAASTGNPVSIRTAGSFVTLAGVTAGALYYVGATPGAISSAPTVNRQPIGVANSSSSLVFPPVATILAPRATGMFSSVGNVGSGEDDLTGYTQTVAAGRWKDGDTMAIRACGTLASNTNSKTLRLVVDTQKVSLIVSTANVATNRWNVNVVLMRTANTTARLMGTSSFDATTGGAPTQWHFTSSITGLNWDTTGAVVKLTAEATSDNDITAESATFQEVRASQISG